MRTKNEEQLVRKEVVCLEYFSEVDIDNSTIDTRKSDLSEVMARSTRVNDVKSDPIVEETKKMNPEIDTAIKDFTNGRTIDSCGVDNAVLEIPNNEMEQGPDLNQMSTHQSDDVMVENDENISEPEDTAENENEAMKSNVIHVETNKNDATLGNVTGEDNIEVNDTVNSTNTGQVGQVPEENESENNEDFEATLAETLDSGCKNIETVNETEEVKPVPSASDATDTGAGNSWTWVPDSNNDKYDSIVLENCDEMTSTGEIQKIPKDSDEVEDDAKDNSEDEDGFVVVNYDDQLQ